MSNNDTTLQTQLNQVNALGQMSMPEIYAAIECGEFAWASCLCSPAIRALAAAVERRMSVREQRVFYKTLCGCDNVVPVPPTTPTVIVPTSYSGPPVSIPAPPATPAAAACPTTLPDANYLRDKKGGSVT
jgi:hypothetical protein